MAAQTNDSNDGPPSLKEGLRLLESGDVDAAIANFSRVIEAEPGRAAAYRLRGSAHLRKRAYLSSIADLDQAIRLAPKDAVAYYVRGRARHLSKDPEGAVADFDQAIKLKPDYVKAVQAREAAVRDKASSGDEAVPVVGSFPMMIVNLASEFLNMLAGNATILLLVAVAVGMAQGAVNHPIASILIVASLLAIGGAFFVGGPASPRKSKNHLARPAYNIVWQRAAIGIFLVVVPAGFAAPKVSDISSLSDDDDIPSDLHKDDLDEPALPRDAVRTENHVGDAVSNTKPEPTTISKATPRLDIRGWRLGMTLEELEKRWENCHDEGQLRMFMCRGYSKEFGYGGNTGFVFYYSAGPEPKIWKISYNYPGQSCESLVSDAQTRYGVGPPDRAEKHIRWKSGNEILGLSPRSWDPPAAIYSLLTSRQTNGQKVTDV
ncbi:tetratricopeptide repeat protein [Bradyrhizobium sp. 197]|uniref:tetratricopeptide repeat protein n=1 Tax=Bradyrhizobium sp. 197 TaxID=2782663 RepID=UPI001FFBA045|nr:tetratricopeptide repeat protein [Bradyrhizobium sp. 197]MCK1480610.1 tetratricopeptide repeat protein [Bradyrhizobium sp. 197]